jgi:hypothetical protein
LDEWRIQALETTLGEQTEWECFHRVARMNTRKRTISRQFGAVDLATRTDDGASEECYMNPLDIRSSNDATVVMIHVVVNPQPPTGPGLFRRFSDGSFPSSRRGPNPPLLREPDTRRATLNSLRSNESNATFFIHRETGTSPQARSSPTAKHRGAFRSIFWRSAQPSGFRLSLRTLHPAKVTKSLTHRPDLRVSQVPILYA